MSRKTIRVLIVDDHAIVREGYRALLAKHEGITVVGEACDAASAYQCYKDKEPDVCHYGHFDAGPRWHRRDQAYPRV
jgi:two-component system invasion response regulator UvrY